MTSDKLTLTEEEILEKKKEIQRIRKNDCYMRNKDVSNARTRSILHEKEKKVANTIYEKRKALQSEYEAHRAYLHTSHILEKDSQSTYQKNQKNSVENNIDSSSVSTPSTTPSTARSTYTIDNIEEREKVSHMTHNTKKKEKVSPTTSTPDIEKVSHTRTDTTTSTPGNQLPDNVVVVKPDDPTQPLPPILLAKPQIKKHSLSASGLYYLTSFGDLCPGALLPLLNEAKKDLNTTTLTVNELMALDLIDGALNGKKEDKKIYWQIQQSIYKAGEKQGETPKNTPKPGSILDRIMAQMPDGEIIEDGKTLDTGK